MTNPKPTVQNLGIDVEAQQWLRASDAKGALEVAFTGSWVLMRVSDDPEGRVLVYDHYEWECFLHGAKNGEFDDAV